ncbi:hypothetical protein JOC37_002612 [Desulfohalotomaculum tongense]|uniref:hypothetical protein n=1 Tax=Desulforadius tongensis TaxID=1216062 RepID=UPI00195BA039|nr:hypothetical protein [Desulforadius tongensis]MBM7856179.1 hypothetical protein [Desulforadius tongensis]
MKAEKIIVKVMQAGSKEECHDALAEARRYVFRKLVAILKRQQQQKSEHAC